MRLFRDKEPWMVKDARVEKSGIKGKLTHFTTAVQAWDGRTVVMCVYWQIDGDNKSFPVNAFDIDPVKEPVATTHYSTPQNEMWHPQV